MTGTVARPEDAVTPEEEIEDPCCAELEDGGGTAIATSPWVEKLRVRTSRYPAFQGALRQYLTPAQRPLGGSGRA